MEKRTNKYRITLEPVALVKENNTLPEPVVLEFENHDDIFKIIKILSEKNLFENDSQSAEFAIGLTMFSGVMMKNKTNPLFKEFVPAFIEFMKKLKS